MMNAVSPSGGLVWHGRALTRAGLWADFRESIETWLHGWRPACAGLLLLGPSAGWCLPASFLMRYRSIHAVDLDPLAPWLFKARHHRWLTACKVHVAWERRDLFAHLDNLLQRFPGHAVLFANVLGQRGFHCEDAATTEAELAALKDRLAGRQWASFHDRISGDFSNLDSLGASFRTNAPIDALSLVRRVAREGHWNDHLTTQVLPEHCERHLMPWLLCPGRVHWVEAGVAQ